MDLHLFDRKKIGGHIVNEFIEELKKALKKEEKKEITTLEDYNLYEKKKIFLDNKSRRGNTLVWIMDEDSVCLSENGDGGPIALEEIKLPNNRKVGEVYEKIGDIYQYNAEITKELNKIKK